MLLLGVGGPHFLRLKAPSQPWKAVGQKPGWRASLTQTFCSEEEAARCFNPQGSEGRGGGRLGRACALTLLPPSRATNMGR